MILLSCKEQMSQSDRNAAREATQSQKIRKIGEAEIISAGLERGKNIAIGGSITEITHANAR